MKQVSYASSEGSDEPAHPRKIASARHLRNRFIYHTSVNVCTPTLLHAKISLHTAHAVLSAPLFLEQNIKHFVGPDLGPNCPLKNLGGGGGAGSSTANSISAADKRTG